MAPIQIPDGVSIVNLPHNRPATLGTRHQRRPERMALFDTPASFWHDCYKPAMAVTGQANRLPPSGLQSLRSCYQLVQFSGESRIVQGVL